MIQLLKQNLLTVTVSKDNIWVFATEFQRNSLQVAVARSSLDEFPNLAASDNNVRYTVALQ